MLNSNVVREYTAKQKPQDMILYRKKYRVENEKKKAGLGLLRRIIYPHLVECSTFFIQDKGLLRLHRV